MSAKKSSTPSQSSSLDGSRSTFDEDRVVEVCSACGTKMDVTEIAPFSEIHCPACGHGMRARTKFNNFSLLAKVGEGGLGTVYRALDVNLNREVALKVLRKAVSSSTAEQEKLGVEARMTASINHPHVVKVFQFGQDHGQFYIAMELVSNGSLDDLMNIQTRVAEVQMLGVAIQIAQGLDAALNVGLIHRDIKPGNILFADSHTAKLVDFGLAILMDEEAQTRGEIWGTPYYIAPEKLDNQPEDFRSDIYSLGGTIFHALAGRPPYEAESASMVALKQLKSQPVSLQAFAPDISSETTYVINRMMAKSPDERYQSYEELIGHLTYARDKTVERAQGPRVAKQRVVMETEQTKHLRAYLSLGLLVLMLVIGIGGFLMRDRLFPASQAQVGVSKLSAEEANELIASGANTASSGDIEGARTEFRAIGDRTDVPEPALSYALLNEAIMSSFLSDKESTLETLKRLNALPIFSQQSEDAPVANFFPEASRVVLQGKKIDDSISDIYPNNEDTLGLLLFAAWNWEVLGEIEAGGPLFQIFDRRSSAPEWVVTYRALSEKYIADWKLLRPIAAGAIRANTVEKAKLLITKIEATRDQLQSGTKAVEYLDALKEKLAAQFPNS